MLDTYKHRRRWSDYQRYGAIDLFTLLIIAVAAWWAFDVDLNTSLNTRDLLWFIALVGVARAWWHWGRGEVQRQWDATTSLRFEHEMSDKSAIDALVLPEDDALDNEEADSVTSGLEAVLAYQQASRDYWEREYALRKEALQNIAAFPKASRRIASAPR